LAVHQTGERALLVSHDPRGYVGRELLERNPRLMENIGLDVPECRDVLVEQRLPVRCGLLRRNETGVFEVISPT
jgi:hypothetical protein